MLRTVCSSYASASSQPGAACSSAVISTVWITWAFTSRPVQAETSPTTLRLNATPPSPLDCSRAMNISASCSRPCCRSSSAKPRAQSSRLYRCSSCAPLGGESASRLSQPVTAWRKQLSASRKLPRLFSSCARDWRPRTLSSLLGPCSTSHPAITRRYSPSASSSLPCSKTVRARTPTLRSVSSCIGPRRASMPSSSLRKSTAAVSSWPQTWRSEARLYMQPRVSGCSKPSSRSNARKARL
mmetsp:Transcript_1163/g.2886  ORF Transcript_1163/g.2886 Transcript_1163/m.2886 type:complete len:241 (+) Transcript_1163:93-815(+)